MADSRSLDLPFSNPTTSKRAARSARPTAKQVQDRVERFIREGGSVGSTCDEIETHLRLLHQSASARVRKLAQMGRIEDSGRTRKTRAGRDAIVWLWVRPEDRTGPDDLPPKRPEKALLRRGISDLRARRPETVAAISVLAWLDGLAR